MNTESAAKNQKRQKREAPTPPLLSPTEPDATSAMMKMNSFRLVQANSTPLKAARGSLHQRARLSGTSSPVLNASSSNVSTKALTMKTLNPSVIAAEYAVRGEIAIRAEELRDQLETEKGRKQLGFSEIINCNIGNPQQLGQAPVTFFRQVSALLECPDLLGNPITSKLFPKDAIERARVLLDSCGGNIGAYSHSKGIPAIRRNVAKFIEERDGFVAEPENIFLTAGASQGVQMLLQCLIQNPNVGVMIPIPQYPLYTATLSLNNGKAVPYYLNEEKGWSLSVDELEKSLQKAKKEKVDVRALVVINPGNPTGNVLSAKDMEGVIQFCRENRLMLLADEVYQTNIYQPKERPFHSFKKILKSMGSAYEDQELVSFHSISKGVIGECGRRGGYFECVGLEDDVMDQIYKMASVSLCPPVQGQVMVDLMVNPPRKGDPSYALYQKEYDGMFESLQRRAKKMAAAFNKLEGASCQNADGAMYTFPTIHLPKKAIEEAKKRGKQPDAFYVLELLNATGVCMVPGSGFGQKPGTFHFRSTFLPPEDVFDDFLERIQTFHQSFMTKYRDN